MPRSARSVFALFTLLLSLEIFAAPARKPAPKRSLADQIKQHRAKRRDYRREEPMEVLLDRSSLAIQEQLAASVSSPSVHSSRREQAVLLADALEKLPTDYREVFLLRNLERIPFEEIATRMNRSSGAVRMLWTRAIKKLSQLLKEASP
jgi:RNA polymerase sigma-70 factor (ECF subfamily)